MSLKFFVEILMFVSLGAALYVIARALPRISSREPESLPSLATHWTTRYIEKADEWWKVRTEKFLRRVKIVILRIDNSVTKRLAKAKKERAKEIGFPQDAAEENGSPKTENDKENNETR